MTAERSQPAPRFWWRIKVAAGAALIALLCSHFLLGFPQALLGVPRWLAQAVVLTGGAITLWHHRILVRGRGGDNPGELVEGGGLYRLIRHPMYLGDCLLYIGMGLLVPSLVSTVLVVIGCAALITQAKAEDRYLANRFGESFSSWQQRSGLLLPGL
jgi:protein-S-isoprenylcysteine O-methyltransferase Ste14